MPSSPSTTPPYPDSGVHPTLRLTGDDSGREALLKLSTAADRFSKVPDQRARDRRRPWFLIPATAGVFAGCALFLAERAEHRGAAVFRLPIDLPASKRAFLRKELLDCAWNQVGASPEAERPTQWFVDSPDHMLLRLSFHTPQPDANVESLRVIAASYLERLRSLAQTERDSPTEAEDILSDYLGELHQRLAESQTQVDGAVAALPAANPAETRDGLRKHWKQLRGEFDATRRQLSDATDALQRMRGDPEPAHGLVSSQERESAIRADVALVADLNELRVSLSELKKHTLAVLEASAAPLSTLGTSSTELLRIVDSDARSSTGEPLRKALSELAAASASYDETLVAFTTDWNRDRKSIAGAEPNPYGSELLDLHAHTRDRLSGFLFAGGKHLAGVRTGVARVGELVSDSARHHVWHSDLVRGFQALQACHHRFEFVASRVEGTENFRLDAALRSSLGLRRRTQEMLLATESRLQDEAVERERKKRIAEITAADDAVERVRGATDHTVDELINLQDSLNLSSDLSEEFHRAVVQLETATNRLQITQMYLRTVEDRLAEMQTKRRANRTGPPVELVSCAVVDRSANFTARLRTGGVGAILAFAAAAALRWWITRRD